MPLDQRPPAKVHGLKHIFAAVGYSLGGLKRLWKETAFRLEFLAGCGLLFGFLLIGATLAQTVLLAILILATLAIEALNTAIEEIVDLVSPNYSLAAKHAKDLGSLAVLCLLLSCGLFAAFVIVTKLLENT